MKKRKQTTLFEIGFGSRKGTEKPTETTIPVGRILAGAAVAAALLAGLRVLPWSIAVFAVGLYVGVHVVAFVAQDRTLDDPRL